MYPNYTPVGRRHLYSENSRSSYPTYRRGSYQHHLPLSGPPPYSRGFHPAVSSSQGSDRVPRLLPVHLTPPSSPCPSSSLSSSSCTCSECCDRRNRTVLGHGSNLLMEAQPPLEGTFGRSASADRFGMPSYHQQAGPSGQHPPQRNQPFDSLPINSGGFNNNFYASGAALALNLQNPGTYWVDVRADIEVGGGRGGGPAPQQGATSASGGGRLVQVPMNGPVGPGSI